LNPGTNAAPEQTGVDGVYHANGHRPEFMNLRELIALAKREGASDLHLEPGLCAVLRVRGSLRSVGEPLAPPAVLEWAREMIGADYWPEFLERRSFDLSFKATLPRKWPIVSLVSSRNGFSFGPI
jgi:Tfp pilus assembly pilus retraction ATPase PilT